MTCHNMQNLFRFQLLIPSLVIVKITFFLFTAKKFLIPYRNGNYVAIHCSLDGQEFKSKWGKVFCSLRICTDRFCGPSNLSTIGNAAL
jgi:hypothetical protein